MKCIFKEVRRPWTDLYKINDKLYISIWGTIYINSNQFFIHIWYLKIIKLHFHEFTMSLHDVDGPISDRRYKKKNKTKQNKTKQQQTNKQAKKKSKSKNRIDQSNNNNSKQLKYIYYTIIKY